MPKTPNATAANGQACNPRQSGQTPRPRRRPTRQTPQRLCCSAGGSCCAHHTQRAPTPETVLTGADAELRAVLRETPQRARAAVQAVVGRIVDAPDDERFQRINAESRTFRETGLEEGRALLAALGFVEDGAHLVWSGS